MKKIFTLLTIACMVFTGCTDDDLFGKKGGYAPAKPGDEIVFGGSMTYKSAKKSGQTRTVYGDKLETGTEIKWLAGDKVRIYCDQAYVDPTNPADVKYCDYSVTGAFSGAGQITGNGDDTAYETCSLEKYSAVGLRWGEASVDGHYFFGVYPSPEQFNESQDLDAKSKLEIKAEEEGKVGKLTAYLPSLQYPARYVAKSGTTYTMHPAMRYAYMVGAAKANPSDGGVNMLFVPVVAAVEMTLNNEGESTVEDIDMITLTSTEGKAIAGNFTTTIAMDANGVTDIANSENVNKETSDEYKSVSVPVYQLITNTDGSTTTTTVDLAKGESIKFTVFMLLHDDVEALNSLKVSLRAGGITKAATVSGVKIVQAKKKNFLNGVGVSIQNQITLDYSKWMASLDEVFTVEDQKISPLSIPGAGGAWSGNYTTTTAADGTVTKNYAISDPAYRQQNLNFEELWNCGIRCFEAQVDTRATTTLIGTFSKDFNNRYIYCNGQSTDMLYNDVVKQLRQKVYANEKTEFAFLIVTYFEEGGYGNRDSGAWQQTINAVLNGMSRNTSSGLCGVKLWTPDMTIKEARGNLLVIARPGSIGVDYGWHGLGTANANILSILGWGSMPDQWYARGYGKLQRYYTGDGTNDTYDKTNVNELTGYRPFTVVAGEKAEVISDSEYNQQLKLISKDFGYYAVSNSKALYGGLCVDEDGNAVTTEFVGQNAYVQEWKRVVNGDFSHYDSTKECTYFWKSNVDEKWNDIVNCLNASMEDSTRDKYDYYINSLCGYFVTSEEPLSYYPTINVQRYNNKERNVYCDGKYQSEVSGNFFVTDFSISNYGPYHANAGDAGDIATYASWVNGKFYSHLQGLMTASGGLGGKPTGIVLMDRVSNTTDNMAGLNIARIIIANNFENTNTAEGASVMRISLDEEEVNSGNSGEYSFAAPEKR